MSQRLNVLLVTDEMLPGGVARHVTDLANGLLNRGVNVHVVATDGPYTSRLERRIAFKDARLLRSGTYRKEGFGALETWGCLSDIMRRSNVNVIHTHKRYSDLIGRGIALTFRIPHISTCHNTFKGGRWLSRFGDHTIAVSEAIHQMLVSDFGKTGESVTTIKNEIPPLRSIRPGTLRALHREYRINDNAKIILGVAQFIPAKDHATLVQALAIVRKRAPLPSWVCVLVGHGPLKESLEQRISMMGLSDFVRFVPGTVDVEPLYNMAEFCVLASVRDGGIPYTIMEAASLKKPYVACSVGGIPEFISHNENGILVPPREPTSFANALTDLLKDGAKVKRLGNRAYVYYNKYHSSRGFVLKTIEVYKKVLQSKSPRR